MLSVSVASDNTLTISGTTNGVVTHSTTVSNYALNTGKINITKVNDILNANGSTITLTGTSGTLLTVVTDTNVTYGTSTFVINSDADVTLISNIPAFFTYFYNLQLSPTLTTNRTYTVGGGALPYVANNFDINPTAASSLALTVNMGGPILVGATTTITGAGSATSVLDTAGHNLTTFKLDIALAGTLTANGSRITLTGTSSPAFTRTGTFTAGTSTVVFIPNASVTLTSGTITFNNLEFSPNPTANRTYTLGSGALTINGNWASAPYIANNQFINSLIYATTTAKYVAGGYDDSTDGSEDAIIWESTNLTSWTKRTVDTTAGSQQNINSLIYATTTAKYVAGGYDTSGGSSDAVVWESTNLTSWTKRTVDTTGEQQIYTLVYDSTNGKYVVGGY